MTTYNFKMQLLLRFLTIVVGSTVITLFTLYLDLLHFLDAQNSWFFNDVKNSSLYDYIVVGAGTAGTVLVAELVKNGEKVLLVEAGGIPPPFIDIPLVSPVLQNTIYDWQYVTVPQENACKGLTKNRSRWPMGKIVGGTSRLNYMAYVRGHPLDFQDWFPDFTEPIVENGGPVRISNSIYCSPIQDAILMGLKAMGQPIVNINQANTTGFMKAELTMQNSKRWSTDKLLHGINKEYLKLVTHAQVNKVLFESNRAVGIKFNVRKNEFQAFAKKGVVLSAGVVGSPKILLLSGIGPKHDLQELKINPIVDLPVGKHLVDHVLIGIDLVKLNSNAGLNIMDALNPIAAFNYFVYGKGPWTSSGIEVLGTFRSSVQTDKMLPPDLQLMVLPLGISKDRGIVLKKALGVSDKMYNEYFAPLENENTVTIAPILLHPKSHGELRLRSSDPSVEPLIDPRYLSDPDDVALLVEGLEFVKNLTETEPMKALGASIYQKSIPGCEEKLFGSSEYWECYIRHLTFTSYHPAGTCRMGDVVDKSFRVYGTSNLYVVDASVFPRLPSGNIQAPVIMVAEKAAKMLRKRNKYHPEERHCHKLVNFNNLFNYNYT